MGAGRIIQLSQSAMPETGTVARLLIADVSGSMRGRRIARLKESLRKTQSESKARILAFSYSTWWCDTVADLPEPDGGTDLAPALTEAAKVWPSNTILFSDGCPNDEEAAIKAAALLPGVISCVFVGEDETGRGMAFMRRLARIGGGEAVHRDLGKVLGIEDEVRKMFALSGPIAL